MTTNPIELIWRSVQDPRNGWSIGSFGAIGEFLRRHADRGRDLGQAAPDVGPAIAGTGESRGTPYGLAVFGH